jgi:hypothetical protein
MGRVEARGHLDQRRGGLAGVTQKKVLPLERVNKKD